MTRVAGKRSPRWAFMQRMTIPCEDGTDYLTRLRIVQTPWFGVYLHDLMGPDKDDPHDHPWDFYSFIVKGAYTETVHPAPAVDLSIGKYTRTWRQFSWHRMDRYWAHRIWYVAPGTKSLIFVGKRSRTWGFYKDGEWIPWETYEDAGMSRKSD